MLERFNGIRVLAKAIMKAVESTVNCVTKMIKEVVTMNVVGIIKTVSNCLQAIIDIIAAIDAISTWVKDDMPGIIEDIKKGVEKAFNWVKNQTKAFVQTRLGGTIAWPLVQNIAGGALADSNAIGESLRVARDALGSAPALSDCAPFQEGGACWEKENGDAECEALQHVCAQTIEDSRSLPPRVDDESSSLGIASDHLVHYAASAVDYMQAHYVFDISGAGPLTKQEARAQGVDAPRSVSKNEARTVINLFQHTVELDEDLRNNVAKEIEVNQTALTALGQLESAQRELNGMSSEPGTDSNAVPPNTGVVFKHLSATHEQTRRYLVEKIVALLYTERRQYLYERGEQFGDSPLDLKGSCVPLRYECLTAAHFQAYHSKFSEQVSDDLQDAWKQSKLADRVRFEINRATNPEEFAKLAATEYWSDVIDHKEANTDQQQDQMNVFRFSVPAPPNGCDYYGTHLWSLNAFLLPMPQSHTSVSMVLKSGHSSTFYRADGTKTSFLLEKKSFPVRYWLDTCEQKGGAASSGDQDFVAVSPYGVWELDVKHLMERNRPLRLGKHFEHVEKLVLEFAVTYQERSEWGNTGMFDDGLRALPEVYRRDGSCEEAQSVAPVDVATATLAPTTATGGAADNGAGAGVGEATAPTDAPEDNVMGTGTIAGLVVFGALAVLIAAAIVIKRHQQVEQRYHRRPSERTRAMSTQAIEMKENPMRIVAVKQPREIRAETSISVL